jgi:hypothetical protein
MSIYCIRLKKLGIACFCGLAYPTEKRWSINLISDGSKHQKAPWTWHPLKSLLPKDISSIAKKSLLQGHHPITGSAPIGGIPLNSTVSSGRKGFLLLVLCPGSGQGPFLPCRSGRCSDRNPASGASMPTEGEGFFAASIGVDEEGLITPWFIVCWDGYRLMNRSGVTIKRRQRPVCCSG